MEEIWKKALELGAQYGVQILLALIGLVVGLKVIKVILSVIEKRLVQKRLDATAQPFLLGLVRILLKFALIILVAQTIGVKTTSFVAILGAAGLAISLSLKDSLGNFAASFLILFFRPYQMGDYIETQGQSGTVKEIQLFSTVLITPDNRRVIIPNGSVFSGPIINYTAEPTRRQDLIFGIAYENAIPKAKSILKEISDQEDRILKVPEPLIAVQALADSSVNLLLRFWSKKEDYWDLNFDLQERVKLTFDEKGISIPYPQRVIHQGNSSSVREVKPQSA